MPSDFKEKFLREKLMRLKAEAELLVLRHDKTLKDYEKTEKELESYKKEKQEAEKSKTTTKKSSSSKRRTKKKN